MLLKGVDCGCGCVTKRNVGSVYSVHLACPQTHSFPQVPWEMHLGGSHEPGGSEFCFHKQLLKLE